jgi:hypothetical protein
MPQAHRVALDQLEKGGFWGWTDLFKKRSNKGKKKRKKKDPRLCICRDHKLETGLKILL